MSLNIKESSTPVAPVREDELDELFAQEEREQAAADARYLELAASYPADVRALYDVMRGGTGVSGVIRQLLQAVHHKRGTLDVHELWRLDRDNRSHALRLIEAMTMPSMLCDAGLTSNADGKPILTNAEIAALLSGNE